MPKAKIMRLGGIKTVLVLIHYKSLRSIRYPEQDDQHRPRATEGGRPYETVSARLATPHKMGVDGARCLL